MAGAATRASCRSARAFVFSVPRGVRVRVGPELARAGMPSGRVVALPGGSVVELDREVEAPIDLYADGMRVATWTGHAWWKFLTAQWSFNTHDKNLPAGQFGTLYGDSRSKQADTRATIEVKAEPKIGETLVRL